MLYLYVLINSINAIKTNKQKHLKLEFLKNKKQIESLKKQRNFFIKFYDKRFIQIYTIFE